MKNKSDPADVSVFGNSNHDDLCSLADRKLWEQELDEFVPVNIFDAHTHLWDRIFANTLVPCDNDWGRCNTNLSELKMLSSEVFPGRDVHFLSFATPIKNSSYENLNEWVVTQLEEEKKSRCALLVSPEMSADYITGMICKHRTIIALKPYYSLANKPHPAIIDYLPEHHMEIANENEMAIILHLPKGPKREIDDLEHFSEKYPCIQWVLAHCAGSFQSGMLEDAIRQLCEIPNLWYDTAVISNTDTLQTLLRYENRKRVLFGTDNALGIGGCRRGRMSSDNWPPHAILCCYEQLLAFRLACVNLELSRFEIENIFYGNAYELCSILRK